jgi:hypothetical protein
MRARSPRDRLAVVMLGAPPTIAVPATGVAPGDVVLRLAAVGVCDAQGKERVADAGSGEAAGSLAFRSCSGQLLRAIAGRVVVNRGTLERRGAVALVPDRQRALILGFSLTENVVLKMRGGGGDASTGPRVNCRGVLAGVRCARSFGRFAASSLSGGNQQNWCWRGAERPAGCDRRREIRLAV